MKTRSDQVEILGDEILMEHMGAMNRDHHHRTWEEMFVTSHTSRHLISHGKYNITFLSPERI